MLITVAFRKRLLLCSLWGGLSFGSALSHSVVFPIKQGYDSKSLEKIVAAFERVVDSADYIQRELVLPTTTTTSGDADSAWYKIPVFGEDCVLTFRVQEQDEYTTTTTKTPSQSTSPAATTTAQFEMRLDSASKEDFGWICSKFYESRNSFSEMIDVTNLRQVVFTHMNSLPPHPGFDAALARLAGSDRVKDLFSSTGRTASDILKDFSSNGFVVLDGPETSEESNRHLSKYLLHKTGQTKEIRSDTVAFLEREDAVSCGLESQFDLLMGVASFLNSHYQFEASEYLPIAPGTSENPLTNPKSIQAAEYGMGDFYVSHSDNSWSQNEKEEHCLVRKNFRSFTAILYCNADWTSDDGGALRIYKDSTQLRRTKDACASCDYTDVVPQNGKLVLFDSKLVHSVEKVLTNRQRRALTIWIMRPSEERVQGEIIDVPP